MPRTTSLSWTGYPCKSVSIGSVNEMPATQHVERWETAPYLCIALQHLEEVCVENKTNRYILHCRRHCIENHLPHACLISVASFPKILETPMFARRWLPICPAPTPHIRCLFVELIQQLLNLPQRIYLLLFTWAVVVVCYCKVLTEVLSATSRFDSLARCGVLLLEGGADKVTTKQWLLVLGAKPVINLWLWGEAICKKHTKHLVHLSAVKGNKIRVLSASCSIRIGPEICCSNCPIN